jgi:hypothetical protein
MLYHCLLFCLSSFFIFNTGYAQHDMIFASESPYTFNMEPIDVVIPTIEKDLPTLNLCIAGIKANCPHVRRVIVISSRQLTEEAEWFDEKLFPFDKQAVAFHLLKENTEEAARFLDHPHSRVGWYYQQLLKLYAAYVIPDISSNILALDSDTIFLNTVHFIDEEGCGLFNPGTEYHSPYFEHADCLLPGFKKLFPEYSGISHHMLFQQPILEDFFKLVEEIHQKPLWQAFCQCVNQQDLYGSGASEYELYFNFAFSRTQQVKIRPLKWDNVCRFDTLDEYQQKGYDYVSCHEYLRN